MKTTILILFSFLLIPTESLCQDFKNIGEPIYFAKSAKELGHHQSDADIDGDGIADVVALIAYDKKTSFFKATKLIDIADIERVRSGEKKVFLPNKPPKTPHYAIVVFLSSKGNLPYVLYNSTYFREHVNDTEIRSGWTLIPRSNLEAKPLEAPLNLVELKKSRIRGDLLEVAGCGSPPVECDQVVLIYWNGKNFEQVWVGGYGG